MLTIIGFLLVVWLIFILIGAFAHGLFWLLIIGVILFVATGVFGYIKRDVLNTKK